MTGLATYSDNPIPDHTTAALRVGLPARVRFVIWSVGGMVEMPSYKEIIIGRSSPTSEVDVDLTPFDAQMFGISRQHILIAPHGSRLLVKDLNSANGSKLNDDPMIAGHVYDLHHGAKLTLGKLHLDVFFA